MSKLFTQKHYEHLIKEAALRPPSSETIAWLCAVFAKDNPCFKPALFTQLMEEADV